MKPDEWINLPAFRRFLGYVREGLDYKEMAWSQIDGFVEGIRGLGLFLWGILRPLVVWPFLPLWIIYGYFQALRIVKEAGERRKEAMERYLGRGKE